MQAEKPTRSGVFLTAGLIQKPASRGLHKSYGQTRSPHCIALADSLRKGAFFWLVHTSLAQTLIIDIIKRSVYNSG